MISENCMVYSESGIQNDTGVLLFPFNSFKNNNIYIKNDLIFILGLPAIGKTQLLCNLAQHFYSNNKKVLFISTEYNQERILENIQRFEKNATSFNSKGEIFICSILKNGSFQQVLSEIDKVNPDIVLIDGQLRFLTTDIEGTSGWAKINAVSERIVKEICQERRIPVIGTLLARDGEETKTKEILDPEDAAESTTPSRHASLILSLTAKNADERILAVTKYRYGPYGQKIKLNFDMQNGYISEI